MSKLGACALVLSDGFLSQSADYVSGIFSAMSKATFNVVTLSLHDAG
jgi:hypothetical protein